MADKFLGTALLTKTHIADEALVANRFVKAVTATGTPAHVVYADAGELGIGVTWANYASGELVDVVMDGEWPVIAAENITANTAIAAAADGKAAPATTANEVLGIALHDANTGEPVMVRLSYAGIF